MSTASQQPSPPATPPLGALHDTVRQITENLAGQLKHASSAAPQWSQSQWLLARAVASVQGVSPLLAGSLPWEGPSGWQRFLREQHAHTQGRHARMRELLDRLDDAARSAGIGFVALKGAALDQLQIYKPGERPMADIDVLVNDQDAQPAGQMLTDLGFHRTHINWKHEAYVAGDHTPNGFGENSANPLKVELHTRIRELLPVRATEITHCILPDQARKGLNPYPSRAALMLHLLLHAAGAMSVRAARLIQFQDIARLAATLDSLDWQELLAKETTLDQALWWAYPPLEMAARYCDSIPQAVLTTLACRCPWWIRQTYRRRSVSEVSLSYLWVTAFPGIEWARSPYDALKYVKQRVIPDAQLRQLRKLLANTEPAAAHSTWAHLSQSQRILRWLTSRQARPEALRPIQLALSQPH